MLPSLWKKLLLARMTRTVRRGTNAALGFEPLEDRTTPAAQQIVATTVEFGSAPVVSVYDAATQQLKFTVQAYEASFTGGVRVAVGDVDGDGVEDLITGPGPGGGAVVKEFSGVDGRLIRSFFAGDETNRGGASVAAADFDGDGLADVVVGAVKNGLESIQVIKGTDGTVLKEFRPFGAPIEGVTVAVGDYNGDGFPDVVVGAGVGGAPRVTVIDGQTSAVLLNTFAFESTARGGVQVATGDLNGDGKDEVVAAPGPGGGPRVVALNGGDGTLLHSFFAYPNSTARNGVQVSVFDLDGDGTDDIITANGPGQAPDLKAFNGKTLASIPVDQFTTGLPTGSVPVAAATAPTAFIAATPPDAVAGAPFSYTFVANGSPLPTYTITSGTLPAGLTLAANGVLSGTPTAGGSFEFVVTATNSAGSVASGTVTLDVAPIAVANSSVTSPASGGSLAAGATTAVTFTAADGGNDPVTGLTVAFGLDAASTGTGTFGAVTDNGDGTYTATFTATGAGTATFTATTGGLTITDAQAVTVTAIDPANSSVTSPASGGSLAAGDSTTVTFSAEDGAGTPVAGLTDVVLALTGASTGTGTFGAVTDNGDGTYTATFTATGAGTATFTATTGGLTVTDAQAVTLTGPAITSIAPTSGPTAGGTTVVITGTGFTGATAVTFGGVNATSFVVDSSTQITAVAPAGAAGAADVAVTTAGGTATLAAAYTYLAAPAVTSLAPVSGPLAGGNTITITGTGFTGTPATGVTIGGVASTDAVVVNDTTITVTAPAHAAGAVDVVVTHPGGTSTLAASYTYLAAPSVTSLTPTSGPLTAGTVVTITGTGFTGTPANGVTFGGVAATDAVVVSDTTITVTAPAHAAGAVDVVVTHAGGTDTLAASYTYLAAPDITSIAPTSGPLTAGTVVVITGTGFTGTSTVNGVTFDGTPATSITVDSDTQITVTAPAHAAGAVDVVVTHAGGTDTLAASYTYLAAPSVTSLTPTSGPLTAGTVVTITGTGFTGTPANGVTFGGVAATDAVVVSDTTITVTAPAHAAGAVDVVVTHAGGTDTLAASYTYLAAPAITSLTPTSGPLTAGTVVTITGTGFTGTPANGVTFGGVAATDAVVVSDTTITVTAPAHAAGAVDVVVTHPGGTSTLAASYTYLAAPSVTSLTPTSGPLTAGTVVTITGTGFTGTPANGVTFGGVAATDAVVVSDTTITVTAPAHAAGAVDVVVTHAGGTDTLAASYTYLAAPDITSIAPTSGPLTAGTVVVITGTGFTGTSTVNGVTFDGTPATSITVDSDTQITVTAPAHAAGAVDVVVTHAGGTDTLAASYTYLAVPAITSLSATSGPDTGGNTVVITGTGFTGTSTVDGVRFDGVPATSITIDSDTQITVVVPAHAAGAVDVVVTHAGGTDTLAASYTYLAAPAITSLSATNGPVAGGNTVVITGTGFTGTPANGVTFGGVAATITVDSDTQITALVPAHAAGDVDVVVSHPGGSATLTNGYTYVALPTLTNVTPVNGPTAGGNVVTLTGTNLTTATVVRFGTNTATPTIVNDTTITVTVPAGAMAGAVSIEVDTVGGTATLTNAYTYVDSPTVTNITPTSGSTLGGTSVTITGTEFTTATGVTFDGVAGTNFVVVNDTTITVDTPPGAAGAVDVVVTNAGGSVTQVGGFTYVAPPAITSLNPTTGSTAGGTSVTITGTGFTGATSVTFDGVVGTNLVVVNDTTITVETPAHAAGTVNVVVTNAVGSDTEVGGFTYFAPPSITNISPNSGPIGGIGGVTITGSGFTGATQVTFGANPGINLVVVNDTTITVDAPPGLLGAVDVTVTGPGGSDVEVGGFTYM